MNFNPPLSSILDVLKVNSSIYYVFRVAFLSLEMETIRIDFFGGTM